MRVAAGIVLMTVALLLSACAGPGGRPVASGAGGVSETSSYASESGRDNRSVPKSVVAAAFPNVPISQQTGTAGGMVGDNYVVGAYDVLTVAVFGVPDLTGDFQVGPSGGVGLPLLGEVQASGKTTEQLRAELTSKLGKSYLQSPQVSVAVKEYRSQKVTVEGAVNKGGVFDMQGRMSLLQAVASAEGVTRYGDQQNVVVFRQAGSQRMLARFDLDAIRAGKNEDPQLRSGDVVVVPESTAKTNMREIAQFVPLLSTFALIAF